MNEFESSFQSHVYSRFDYSPEFLAWAMKPPGYLKEWHTGVRVTKSNKLVGFISGVPAHIRSHIRDSETRVRHILLFYFLFQNV